MKKSITIMVPAYNEEKHLEKAVNSIVKIVKNMFRDYEVLIFDDYSSDGTGKIADKLSKRNSKIRVVHNKKNMGLGYNYKKGVKLARKEYFMMAPGEKDWLPGSVKHILSSAGKADMIVPFTVNKRVRPLYRIIISESFVKILNLITGLNLKYYNGMVVHKTKLLKKVKISTYSFAYQAEILVELIKNGHSYIEVPNYIRKTEGSELFRLKNVAGIFKTIVSLFSK